MLEPGKILKSKRTNAVVKVCLILSLSYCIICVIHGVFNVYNQWHLQEECKNSQKNLVNFLKLADVSNG